MILGESLGTQALPLNVHYDDIDTPPLSGSFVKCSVDWKFLIIALMVETGIFTALFFEVQLSFAAHQKYIIWVFSL